MNERRAKADKYFSTPLQASFYTSVQINRDGASSITFLRSYLNYKGLSKLSVSRFSLPGEEKI